MNRKCETCGKDLTYQKRFCTKKCRGSSPDFSLRKNHCEIPWNKGKTGYEMNSKGENHWTFRAGVSSTPAKRKSRSAARNILRRTLERSLLQKNDKTERMLGYSSETLRKNIEMKFLPGMTWENYGDWHIDHINQVHWFPVGTAPSVVNALDNLRPLWAKDNLKRKRKETT